MKLNDNFIVHNSEDEHILIDASGEKFSGLVRSNSTAGVIIDCLSENTTEDEIVSKMLEIYEDAPENKIREDVSCVISKLRKIGAIDE